MHIIKLCVLVDYGVTNSLKNLRGIQLYLFLAHMSSVCLGLVRKLCSALLGLPTCLGSADLGWFWLGALTLFHVSLTHQPGNGDKFSWQQ